jgi:hypothetical protein
MTHTEKSEKAGARSISMNIIKTLALVVLTQLPFWLMQTQLSIQRPIFNLDLFVALLVASWNRRWGLIVLCVAWAAEIARDASISYHFVDTGDFLDAARFIDLVQVHHILSWQLIVGVGAMVACAAAVYLLVGTRSPPKILIIVLALLAFGGDTLNGSNRILGLGGDRFRVSANIAGSPGWNIVFMARANWQMSSEPLKRLADRRTFERALAWQTAQPRSSVLLVLVESMGLARSPQLRDWLGSRLETPSVMQRWTMRRDSEAFFGPTVYGELRVLCGLEGHYSRLKRSEELQCLPHRFVEPGEHALGLHGFNLQMFDRQRWWRELGLEPQVFDSEPRGPETMDCNEAFPGVCDGVVLERAVELADAPSRLVYVVTLDTHLPLPTAGPAPRPDLAHLCAVEEVPPLACRMVDGLGSVLDKLALELSHMQHPPLVLVVGDHAPPFLQAAARDAFDQARVPAFTLEPRGPTTAP